MQRFLFWGLVISIHVWMWITASGHRSNFTWFQCEYVKVILDRGTDSVRCRQYLHQWHSYSLSLGTISEDQTHSESAIESCVYITSQLVLISPCLHRLKTTSTIALWRQWDCAKALSWVGTVQDTKSRAAEAANAEMVAKLLTAEASLSEAREEILVL